MLSLGCSRRPKGKACVSQINWLAPTPLQTHLDKFRSIIHEFPIRSVEGCCEIAPERGGLAKIHGHRPGVTAIPQGC